MDLESILNVRRLRPQARQTFPSGRWAQSFGMVVRGALRVLPGLKSSESAVGRGDYYSDFERRTGRLQYPVQRIAI